MDEEKTLTIETEEWYELSTSYGVIKRLFIGILLYWWFVLSGKCIKFSITKKGKKESTDQVRS